MWIKKTSVRTRKGKVTYLQLMRTYYDNGSARQEVMLNLGREDETDLKKAEKLASILDNRPYQFIPREYASMLPMKRYGETFLQRKAFELTSSRRFVEDYAAFLNLPKETVDYLFLLIAYYSFQTGEKSLSSFLSTHFIHNIEKIDSSVLLDTVKLINTVPYIYPGLDVTYRRVREEGKRTVKCLIRAKVAPEFAQKHESILISVTTSFSGFPLQYGWSTATTLTKALKHAGERTIFATLSEEMELFRHSEVSFVSHIDPKQLKKLLKVTDIDSLRKGAFSEPYENYVCTFLEKDGYTIIFRDMKTQYGSTGDIFISNDTELSRDELNTIIGNLTYSDDYFYRIFVPSELDELRDRLSGRDLAGAVVTLSFTRLFIEYQLVQRLEAFGVSLEDVYRIFRDNMILQIGKGKHRILIHTPYTEEQEKILGLVSFNHLFGDKEE